MSSLGHRPTAGLWILVPAIQVRILVAQPFLSLLFTPSHSALRDAHRAFEARRPERPPGFFASPWNEPFGRAEAEPGFGFGFGFGFGQNGGYRPRMWFVGDARLDHPLRESGLRGHGGTPASRDPARDLPASPPCPAPAERARFRAPLSPAFALPPAPARPPLLASSASVGASTLHRASTRRPSFWETR